jgi:hypothetical protein
MTAREENDCSMVFHAHRAFTSTGQITVVLREDVAGYAALLHHHAFIRDLDQLLGRSLHSIREELILRVHLLLEEELGLEGQVLLLALHSSILQAKVEVSLVLFLLALILISTDLNNKKKV